MSKKHTPTEKELEILQIIWQNGPCTVRTINDKLNEAKKVGYTTTLKFMQIMTEKGFLVRDESERVHVYKASTNMKETQGELTRRFLQQVFGGSTSQLVMRALGSNKTTEKEIEEVKAFIKKMEENGNDL